MSPTGMIVIATAVLVQAGMMGAYISMSRQSKRDAEAHAAARPSPKASPFAPSGSKPDPDSNSD